MSGHTGVGYVPPAPEITPVCSTSTAKAVASVVLPALPFVDTMVKIHITGLPVFRYNVKTEKRHNTRPFLRHSA